MSTRREALIFISIYTLIVLILFAIFETFLYTFVFSLVSILVINFIYKLFRRLRVWHPLSILFSLLLYFGLLIYAIISIIPTVVSQTIPFVEFMQNLLDTKYWNEYLKDNQELLHTVNGIVEWLRPKLNDLLEYFFKNFAKGLPQVGVVIFYTIVFSVYFTIYIKWFTNSIPNIFPKRIRHHSELFFKNLGLALSSYVDVMLLSAFIISISIYILFLPLLPQYAVLLAFWGFVTNLIPIVGVVIEWIPILLVTLSLGLKTFIFVNITVMLIHLIVFLFFIFVMNKRASINPVLMLIFIFIIGLFYGLVGTFFAVPVAIYFTTLWKEFIDPELEKL